MNEDILNFIALTIFLIFISISIFTSSLLGIAQQQKNQVIYQKYLVEQLAQKEKELEIQKDAQVKKYLLGQFDQSQENDFTVVPASYDVGGYTMYLRTETLNAFLNMAAAAEKDGVELNIASATRNFDYQTNLWNNKWNALPAKMDGLTKFKTVLKYSAAPGTSRHHWGTEIDINDANPQYFNTKTGEKVYDWLSTNASLYGFCQPYIAKGIDRTTGYNEEKWHWSYVPLSKNFTEEYAKLISPSDINGFDGDQYVPSLNLIKNYVLGINPQCL